MASTRDRKKKQQTTEKIKKVAIVFILQVPETDAGIRMLQTFGNDLIVGTTMNSLHFVSFRDGTDDLPLSGAVIDPIPITQVQWPHCLLSPPRDQHCPVSTAQLTEHGTKMT